MTFFLKNSVDLQQPCWASVASMPPKGKTVKEDRQMENVEKECKCGSCLKVVMDQDDGVLCEICETWFHSKCQSISDAMYKVISQYRKDLHWFCKGCSGGAEKLLAALGRLQGKIDRIEEEMVRLRTDIQLEISTVVTEFRSEIKQVDNRLGQCELKTAECGLELQKSINSKLSEMESKISVEKEQPKWSEIETKGITTAMTEVTADVASLRKQTEEDKAEQEEIYRRKNCVIIHGLAEAMTTDKQEAKKHDVDLITDLLHELRCDDLSVGTIIRLGEDPSKRPRQEGEEAKPRPVKMVMASESQKDKLLFQAKNLRTTTQLRFKGIFIHQDLTPLQRQMRHKLVLELKERQEKGEKNLILVNGKIVTRRERQENAQ